MGWDRNFYLGSAKIASFRFFLMGEGKRERCWVFSANWFD